MAQIAPFNFVDAKNELHRLARDVNSKPEDQVYVDLFSDLPPLERFGAAASITDYTRPTDTSPILLHPAFTTNAAEHLYNFSRDKNIERQLLVLSISTDFARQVLTPSAWSEVDSTRQLISLSIPTNVAKNILMDSIPKGTSWQVSDPTPVMNLDSAFPVPLFTGSPSFTEIVSAHPVPLFTRSPSFAETDSAYPAPLFTGSPSFTETDAAHQLLSISDPTHPVPDLSGLSTFSDTEAAHQLLAISKSDFFAPDTIVSNEKGALREILKLAQSDDAVNIVPISAIFSDVEITTATKLVNLFASSNTFATAKTFTEHDFLTTHSLLDRFASRKNQKKSDDFRFNPGDFQAAHQLRTLFAADNPTLPVGPMFIVFPDGEDPLQLTLLSKADDGARELLSELSSFSTGDIRSMES
ncbi:hypothetical protein MMC29_006266 [Sticta canariensis]|nr:hypothetical protein [Sticta canariensis]